MKASFGEDNEYSNQFIEAMNEKDFLLMNKLINEGHIDLNKLYHSSGSRCMALDSLGINEVFEFLMEKTDPNLYRGISILQYVVDHGEYSQVKFVLDLGANPNFVVDDPYLPPIFASLYQNIEKLKLLLSYGADPNTINFNGNNLLDELVEIFGKAEDLREVEEVVEKMELLLEKGAFPSEKFFSTFEGTEYYERLIIYKYPKVKGLVPSVKGNLSSEKLDL